MSNTSLESLHDDRDQETQGQPVTAESGRWLAGLFLVLLLVFHVGMNIWWLQADNHTIRTDEEGHMLIARTYHETLFVKDYAGPVQRLIAVSQIRPGNPAHPPLFHFLGALMIAIFGYSTDTIALTNTVFFVFLLLGCHALARTFLNPWQSLFAVFVVSMTPMVYASSRFFMTDFAAAAIIVWVIVALIRSGGLHRSSWVFLFALLMGLGTLTRTITFAYVLFPSILAALTGLIRVAAHRKSPAPDAPSLGGWLVNILMALTVMVGVFAPWYYTNLEPFYDYWAHKEIGGRLGPLTSFVPLQSPAALPDPAAIVPPGPAAAPALTIEAPAPRSFETSLQYAWARVTDPAVAWIRYPVYLVNNGLFIPLAALAVLGMLLAWISKRCRGTALLYLYAWIFGSWFFFSVCLRSGAPRYGLPVAPALALFAALFVLALPGRWFRQCVGVLVIFVLCFLYGNITVQSYGEFGAIRVKTPQVEQVLEKEARHFIDDGLVLYKDALTLSFSYSRLGPPRTDNYKEQFIDIMLAHEKTLPVREGKFANYQKLGLRGMPLYEQHYWPGDNPYRLRSLAPEDMPERALRVIHMGLEPQHLLALLPETDYILYQTDAANAAQVEEWKAFFAARGFDAIASFDVPAFGWVPPTINGVLARRLTGELVPVTATTVAGMNLYDLYELSRSPDFVRLAPDLQGLVRSRLEGQINAIATPFPLNPAVTFMAADVSKTGENMFRFRLIFKVEQAIDRDWRMFFHGRVDAADLPRLPAEKQEQGYMDWNFDPLPATSTWQPGSYVILTHQIETEPMVYVFNFGLFQEDTLFGQTAQLKTMDLGAIP